MPNRRVTGQLIVGAVVAVLGIVYAVLPDDWIEENFHIDPDGGNGSLELIIPLVLIAVGVGVIGRALLTRRAPTARRTDDPVREDL